MNEHTLSDIRVAAVDHYNADRTLCAAELLSVFLKHRPDDAYAWFVYGDCLRQGGHQDAAERALTTALALAPADQRFSIEARLAMMCESRGQFEAAEEHYSKACASIGGDEIDWLWVMRAKNLSRLGYDEQAIECLRKAATFDEIDDLAEIFGILGNILVKLRRFSEALEAFSQALQASPESSWAQQAIDDLTQLNDVFSMLGSLSPSGEK